MNAIHLCIADAIANNYSEQHIDMLLARCPEGECHVCGIICCPNEDGMHFHHDGCPSCAEEIIKPFTWPEL